MHFAIVEDLKDDRENLNRMIRNICISKNRKAEISCFGSAEEFLERYRPGFCSAVFLKILFKNMSGLEAAKEVREIDEHVPIVFTTTDPSFSLESYRVHALDFLLKPVQPPQLAWCMERILKLSPPLYIKVKEARSENGCRIRSVLLDHLIYIETVKNGLLLHTTEGPILTAEGVTFLKMASLLPETGRFHSFCRGQLVNLSHVLTIDGSGAITLDNGQILYCSRRKIRQMQEAFADFQIL